MSYCRWSSDGFQCDLYCYEAVYGGFTTHVACMRRPKRVADYEFSSPENQLQPIGLPHDGETFNDPDLESFLERVLALKAIGYQVPDYVPEMIREEIRQSLGGGA